MKSHTLVDVRKNTALGDGDVAQKLVQLFIVPDCELEMAGNDAGLLIVTGSVTSQLEDLSSQVFKNSGKINGSTCDLH